MKIIEKLKSLTLGKIPVSQKIFFAQQLGIMLKTGISLSIALKSLGEQTENKRLKVILADVRECVEKGNLFSKGLEKYEKIFGPLFINMIKAGEVSGNLEDVLKQLFIQMKKDHGVVSKVKGAMIYPCIVITAMISIGILVIIYVIPNITSIFKEVGATLPFATRALIAMSDFTLKYGWYLAMGAIVFLIIFIRLINIPKGKYIFHKVLLNSPIIGKIIKKINLARFSRTLSSLLRTDIPIVQTFQITSQVLGNVLYKKSLEKAADSIKKGVRIKEALEPYHKLFPPVVLQMIAVGEETGTLDEILEQSAIFYEEEVDQVMTNLPSILEPVLMVILGAGVAGMAVAIIMPMYSLSQQL